MKIGRLLITGVEKKGLGIMAKYRKILVLVEDNPQCDSNSTIEFVLNLLLAVVFITVSVVLFVYFVRSLGVGI